MPKIGSLEVIHGPMFCGKSTELARRLRLAEIARKSVSVFIPEVDFRSGATITTHDGNEITAVVVAKPIEIVRHVQQNPADVVGIDEAQFFDKSLTQSVQSLVAMGVRIIVAGLDQDWKAEPFGSMPELIVDAELADKLPAICMVCGEPGTKTYLKVEYRPGENGNSNIIVGGENMYEARCRKHHDF